ncbi:MAG TPA: sigma-70 family RNA polymerase sigma factor [Longimicrobiaceae bacterium]|nr:sigma-70 family RNA polymerase sigma factor [Longimicrobiaceae bacterium]
MAEPEQSFRETPDEIVRSLERIRGDREALARFLESYRERLRRLIRYRLDAPLRGRLDESDIVQEALHDSLEKIDRYLRGPSLPLFLWLRLNALEKLVQARRRHLGTKKRDARREVRLDGRYFAPATSEVLAKELVARAGATPAETLSHDEQRRQVEAMLASMDELDREIIELRHFEELGNGEVARLLGISETAASSRYFRALERLGRILRAHGAVEAE